MRCPRCQAENRPRAQFCKDCGARLSAACPSCGATVDPAGKFCDTCGAVLSTVPAPSRFASPGAYTPTHLAELILTSKGAIEGERKQVTVLFADMKGSTELIADRDPEEARKILDPVLERMIDAVHRYEGTVNQVMGDGIMALFGAPLAHEDHAVRACYAALRMQESVGGYADEILRAHGVPIHIRVGLNSGEVVVRSIGSDLHMDYSAVGQTTHLAARMEQLAMPGSILITPDTLALAEGYVEVTPLGPINVKGVTEPVEVYKVTGAGPARTRLQAAAGRGLTRFVGRQLELETLRHSLENAGRGQGQVVALIGEPGVGKSRLVWEFIRSHRVHGWLVLESSSVSYGKASVYLPVIDLLKAYFQIEARDDARRIREKLAGKLVTLDESLRPSLPALLSLLDAPVDDTEWKTLEPPARRQRILDAVKRLLLRESQVQPLLLIFEDLHWIDAETQVLLDALIDSLPAARILLLVNYRPEYQHGWGSKTYYTQLRIDPLPPESTEALLQLLLGDDDSLHALTRLLIQRSEGNPFFLEEGVRTLVETGVLAGERGAYRQVKPLERTHVPATVQAMLAARIDRLAPEDKRLLQSASVIGKDVPFVLLQAVAEGSDSELHRGLSTLQAAEFLYESNLFPNLEYTFKHALTHEVTYGGLLAGRRRELHARILAAIESRHSDRLAEQVERLAHHAVRGEIWDKAVSYLGQAGAKAAARGAYRDAVASFEQALSMLPHLPDTPDTLDQAIDLRLDLRQVLFALGEFGRMLEHLREAETAAAARGDQQRLSRITSYLTQDFRAWGIASLPFVMGAHERAVAAAQRSLATAAGDFARQVMANYNLGEACYWLGDYRQAMGPLEKNVELLEGESISARFSRLGFAGLPSVFSRAFLVRCLAELGEFADGIRYGEDAVRIAGIASEFVDVVAAYSALGALYLRRGEADQAIVLLERCLALEPTRSHPYWFPMIAAPLGAAYARSERLNDGLPMLEQAVAHSEQAKIKGGHAQRLASLGEAYLRAGRVDDAARLAEQTLSFSRLCGERGGEAWALWLWGEVASHRDPQPVERAETFYREAMAVAGNLGMRPLLAHCHLGLGTLYRQSERMQEGRSELLEAAGLFRAMEMPYWQTRAEAELGATTQA